MKLVYSLKKITTGQNSIFLAGGTVRTADLETSPIGRWRKQAVSLLKKYGYDGSVYIPEYSDDKLPDGWTLQKQIKWQTKALTNATVILFFIPRDLKYLPCFTTNFQLGEWYKSGKIVVGDVEGSEKNQYLKWKCKNQANLKWENSLQQLVKSAVNKIKE